MACRSGTDLFKVIYREPAFTDPDMQEYLDGRAFPTSFQHWLDNLEDPVPPGIMMFAAPFKNRPTAFTGYNGFPRHGPGKQWMSRVSKDDCDVLAVLAKVGDETSYCLCIGQSLLVKDMLTRCLQVAKDSGDDADLAAFRMKLVSMHDEVANILKGFNVNDHNTFRCERTCQTPATLVYAIALLRQQARLQLIAPQLGHSASQTACCPGRLECTFQGHSSLSWPDISDIARHAVKSMLCRIECMEPADMFTYTDWPAIVRLLKMQLNDWRMIYERACAIPSADSSLSIVKRLRVMLEPTLSCFCCDVCACSLLSLPNILLPVAMQDNKLSIRDVPVAYSADAHVLRLRSSKFQVRLQ